MSYVNMDHAKWVQSNNAAAKRFKPTAAERRAAADHRGPFAAPDQLNAFQRRAFDILGIVGNGIYNAPIAWSGVQWWSYQIIVPWRGSLGTWDFSHLTRFVFLCHDARIRGYVQPSSPGYMKVTLSERSDGGDMTRRHPNLEEAIAAYRADVPLDHSIAYRPPVLETA